MGVRVMMVMMTFHEVTMGHSRRFARSVGAVKQDAGSFFPLNLHVSFGSDAWVCTSVRPALRAVRPDSHKQARGQSESGARR